MRAWRTQTHTNTHTQTLCVWGVLIRLQTQWVWLICVVLEVHNSNGTQALRRAWAGRPRCPAADQAKTQFCFEKRDSSCLKIWELFLWKRQIGRRPLPRCGFDERSFGGIYPKISLTEEWKLIRITDQRDTNCDITSTTKHNCDKKTTEL